MADKRIEEYLDSLQIGTARRGFDPEETQRAFDEIKAIYEGILREQEEAHAVKTAENRRKIGDLTAVLRRSGALEEVPAPQDAPEEPEVPEEAAGEGVSPEKKAALLAQLREMLERLEQFEL